MSLTDTILETLQKQHARARLEGDFKLAKSLRMQINNLLESIDRAKSNCSPP